MMNAHGRPQEPGAAGMGRAEVARRAYEIWEREGRPDGRIPAAARRGPTVA